MSVMTLDIAFSLVCVCVVTVDDDRFEQLDMTIDHAKTAEQTLSPSLRILSYCYY